MRIIIFLFSFIGLDKGRAWATAIKLFTAVVYKRAYLARAFVPGRTFQPSLMFAGKARSQPWREHLKDLTLKYKKGLPGTNTLAYLLHSLIKAVTSSKTLAPGACTVEHYGFVM
jgi:hypothetical protein